MRLWGFTMHMPVLFLVLVQTGRLCLGAPPIAQAPAPTPISSPASGAIVFQNLCLHCHGAKGEGNVTLKAPAIASLPDWYVIAQLQNFQLDLRGAHPADPEGQMMRAMAKVLTAQQIPEVATYVSSLPRVMPVSTASVDPAPGKDLYEERCMECHRYNGEGELVFRSPPLMGLPDWYLAGQLRKFQAGVRGAVEGDEYGKKMILASTHVSDEALLQSLITYLMSLQNPQGKRPSGTFGDD
jgi:cytochrome c553